MSKRAKDVIGKPVVSVEGAKLGTVSDVLISDTGTLVLALIVKAGWLQTEHVLPAAAIQTLGVDAVVSRSSELITAQAWHEQEDAAAG